MNMIRIMSLICLAAIVGLPPAHAYTRKEADILLTVSYAAATAGQKNRNGAEAYCRQAKSTLTATPPDAYLFAHIERCFGLVAATAGDKNTACKRYKNALVIWRRTPPPQDHPQSVASRAQLRDGMIRYRAEKCGGSNL